MSGNIVEEVRQKYAAVAVSSLSGEQAAVRSVAKAFGYSEDELLSVPDEAHMGLSCGNPTATANLRAGEVVVDLGCGGGVDVILAAQKVGPSGRAIGIDMTDEMLARAMSNANRAGIANAEFRKGRIEALPLDSNSVDCLISNCVINLAPDKSEVFREMFRVLKPGGRVAVSDIALKKELPTELARDIAAYVGCIAGAISISEYEQGLREAGFADVCVIDTRKDLNAYAAVEGQAGCCSPAMSSSLTMVSEESCCSPSPVHAGLSDVMRRYDVNEYAASVQVYAVKPS